MRVVVLGAGPAGVLAALALQARGAHVRVIERDRPERVLRPQNHHVHRIDVETWDRLSQWLPTLEAQLQRAGAPVCGDEALGGPPTRAYPRPSRWLFDRILQASLASRRIPLVHMPRPQPVYIGPHWKVGRYEADWIVDATGSARVSLAEVARLQGRPVPVDQGPANGTYRSATAARVRLRYGQLGFTQRGPHGTGSFLWPTEAGLLFTQVLPADLDQPPALPKPLTGAVLGPWRLAGTRRTQRPVLEACDVPDGLLLFGDALVQTPPSLGQGLGHVVRSLDALTLENPAEALQQHAKQAFQVALVQSALAAAL